MKGRGRLMEHMEYDMDRKNEKDGKNIEYNVVREEAAYNAKPHDGYTIEDYCAIPEDQRVELIDGVLYDMASPGITHQSISMSLSIQIGTYINKKGGNCRVFAGPIDVQLVNDNRTMLVPDIIVVCDPDKVKKERIVGAPDFVVEIISHSSRKRDYEIKMKKYNAAGVREYWIVDPERERVLVYDFEGKSAPVIYGMDEKIPVRIFSGELVIAF